MGDKAGDAILQLHSQCNASLMLYIVYLSLSPSSCMFDVACHKTTPGTYNNHHTYMSLCSAPVLV